MMPRRMDHKCAPAASYIQESLSGTQQELAANVLEFCLLRDIEAAILLLKVSAGIDHGAVKPQSVEIVGYVVVKADGCAIFILRVRAYSKGCSPALRLRRQARMENTESVSREPRSGIGREFQTASELSYVLPARLCLGAYPETEVEDWLR
jgi:hypothetical protein